MTMQQITIRLPKEIVREFNRALVNRGQARNVVLTRLVQAYVQQTASPQEIGLMTLATLGIKPQRHRRKPAINAKQIARALKQTFGTDDAVDIVNLNRDHWMAR
jgi:metal-responsive CopG/Arc/MetJ family transcriptional regulator